MEGDHISKNKERNDVPILKNIFNKILCDTRPHCVLCLRTEDEVHLVRPNHLKLYMEATKINEYGNLQDSLVCYICEHKSKNALIFYRSAVLSTSLKLIMKKMIKSNRINKCGISEMKHFKKLLTSVGLSQNLSPADIQKDLESARKNCWLSQTDVDIMDTSQPNLIPNSAVGINGQLNVMTEGDTSALVQYSTLLLAPPALLANPVIATANNQTAVPEAYKAPEECIVLDADDDDEQINAVKPGLSAAPSNKCIQPNPRAHEMKPPAEINFSNSNIALPSCSKVKNKIGSRSSTIEKVAKIEPTVKGDSHNVKRKKPCLKRSKPKCNEENFTTKRTVKFDSQNVENADQYRNNANANLCDPPQPKYFIVQGENAIMLNINDVMQNNMAAINILDKSLPQNKIFFKYRERCDTNSRRRIPNMNSQDKPVEEMTDTSVKMNGHTLEHALCDNKSGHLKITDVKISEISGDMDTARAPRQMRGTDWEDKIPMDVISFMDAVDPNANPALTKKRASPETSTPTNAIKLNGPLSLANRSRKLNADIHLDTEIIDLC